MLKASVKSGYTARSCQDAVKAITPQSARAQVPSQTPLQFRTCYPPGFPGTPHYNRYPRHMMNCTSYPVKKAPKAYQSNPLPRTPPCRRGWEAYSPNIRPLIIIDPAYRCYLRLVPWQHLLPHDHQQSWNYRSPQSICPQVAAPPSCVPGPQDTCQCRLGDSRSCLATAGSQSVRFCPTSHVSIAKWNCVRQCSTWLREIRGSYSPCDSCMRACWLAWRESRQHCCHGSLYRLQSSAVLEHVQPHRSYP